MNSNIISLHHTQIPVNSSHSTKILLYQFKACTKEKIKTGRKKGKTVIIKVSKVTFGPAL
uniref:Uncharacterized protein n=1 Tax=Rhizophora mucronata TaxID=61149 RepID=A0A2P2KM01_RHIMU